MTTDHRYPEEVKSNGFLAALPKTRGCANCTYAYLEAPKLTATICAHPEMTRRFDVTPFVKRREVPQRCPMEVSNA